MHSEEKRIWGIHTKDDNLFLHQDVVAIGWNDMGDLSLIQADRDAFKENIQKYTQMPRRAASQTVLVCYIDLHMRSRLAITLYFHQRLTVR